MATVQRVGDLELEQDLAFQQWSWRVQRVGWSAMLAVVLAALAGLLGNGPLSSATAGPAGGPLRVEYQRLARHGAPTTLQFHLAPGAAPDGTARVWLDSAYLRGATVEGVFPEPESVRAGPDRMEYVFALARPGAPATITFQLQYESKWRQRGRAGLGDHALVPFAPFVYP